MEPVKRYKKEGDYSYTLGPFPTFELLDTRPEAVRAVFYHPSFTDQAHLKERCAALSLPCEENARQLARLSDKENCYVAAVFSKYREELSPERDHVVLVNPSDMGNLGTILRTLAAFGLNDLALIEPCADPFHPKAVRASMGALFRMRTARFPSFEDYRTRYPRRDFFPFLLDGSRSLTLADCPSSPRYSLIFGNEASGLPASFSRVGQSIFIPQSDAVDSLNLSIAVALGGFAFTQKNPR